MATTTRHSIREKGIAVRLYRRGSSPIWTASFRVDGQKIQRSTGTRNQPSRPKPRRSLHRSTAARSAADSGRRSLSQVIRARSREGHGFFQI